MAVVIDFSSLTGELHKVSETLVDQEAREELNPYLLNVILPMLMRGEYPRLKDIDFEQFEQYDPPELVDYYHYDYCWKDSTTDRKGAKIVLFLFEEFSTYYEVADALFTILDFCKANIPRLEAALAETEKDKVIPLPIRAVPEKEAA